MQKYIAIVPETQLQLPLYQEHLLYTKHSLVIPLKTTSSKVQTMQTFIFPINFVDIMLNVRLSFDNHMILYTVCGVCIRTVCMNSRIKCQRKTQSLHEVKQCIF